MSSRFQRFLPKLLRISLNRHSKSDEAASNNGTSDLDESLGQNAKSQSDSCSATDLDRGVESKVLSFLLIFIEDSVDAFRCLVHAECFEIIEEKLSVVEKAPGIVLAQSFSFEVFYVNFQEVCNDKNTEARYNMGSRENKEDKKINMKL